MHALREIVAAHRASLTADEADEAQRRAAPAVMGSTVETGTSSVDASDELELYGGLSDEALCSLPLDHLVTGSAGEDTIHISFR